MDEREQFPYRYATPDEIAQLYVGVEGIIKARASQLFTLYQGAVEYDELLSEGRLCFMKQIQTFDTTKGVKFSTFFSTCVLNAMKDYIKITGRKTSREQHAPAHYEESEEVTNAYDYVVNDAVMRQNFNRTEIDMVDEDMAKNELFSLLDDIADTYMSDNERKVYYLYFRNDVKYNVSEVASMLGMKKYKASELKQKVITILQNHLLEHDIEGFRADYLAGIFT